MYPYDFIGEVRKISILLLKKQNTISVAVKIKILSRQKIVFLHESLEFGMIQTRYHLMK